MKQLFHLGQSVFYVWYNFSVDVLPDNQLEVKRARITVAALENGKIYYGFQENPGARIGQNLITTDDISATTYVECANAATYQYRKYFFNHCNFNTE